GKLKRATGEEELVPTLPGRWRNYYENIARVLAGQEELLVKPEEVRRAIEVLVAGRISAQTGQTVSIERGKK
ncbi:MAG TPA: hypothetical protein PK644_06745, partial [bacterium]|nr:hypothetical protein [bacterium]